MTKDVEQLDVMLANDINPSRTKGNYFPPEVLKNIADRLPYKYICPLFHVCRSWNGALTQELYETVHTYSPERFKLIVYAILHSAEDRHLGHYVRKLYIPHDFNKHTDLLLDLPNLCPYVTELSLPLLENLDMPFYLRKWKDVSRVCILNFLQPPLTLPMDYLRERLRKLSISPSPQTDWITLISKLPCIEELCIRFSSYYGWGTSGNITFYQWEEIHKCLPRLHCLAMTFVNVEGEPPAYVIPCDSLRELNLMLQTGHHWGQYFARKYTQLEKLYLTLKARGTGDYTSDIVDFARSCRTLQHLRLPDRPDYYRLFIDTIPRGQSQLKCIDARLQDQTWFSATIDGFNRTLSEISVKAESRSIFNRVMETLKACPILVDLDLQYPHAQLNVDYVLTRLGGLKRLSLRADKLKVDEKHNKYTHHLLQDISLSANDIADSVYEYLSVHCSRLSSLKCVYAKGCTRACTINYLSAGLKSVHVEYWNRCIFKVTRFSEEERISEHRRRQGDLSNMETIKGFTTWYRTRHELGRIAERVEPEVIGLELRKSGYNGREEEAQRVRESPEMPRIACGRAIISINCSFVDKLTLYGNRTHWRA
ncbi:hypothetical protein EC973_007004 [Apophysomyces ossiformis]|uniref:F-box domain-containing protein n=1 Tax=Apophysomyces ossiformis TaxID=679940 RepID=A0A8H7ERW3_9FUNG|nr:hypothetical protein EC973_007004 [Apophysomyces ossiformis]